jgi:hypothetical protein
MVQGRLFDSSNNGMPTNGGISVYALPPATCPTAGAACQAVPELLATGSTMAGMAPLVLPGQ